MDKLLLLSGQESKEIRVILGAVLLLIFSLFLATSPGQYIATVLSLYGTSHQEARLEFSQQSVYKHKTVYHSTLDKNQERSLFLSPSIEVGKAESDLFVLEEKECADEDLCSPFTKSRAMSKEDWSRFAAHASPSYQIMQLNSSVRPRAPPYIL